MLAAHPAPGRSRSPAPAAQPAGWGWEPGGPGVTPPSLPTAALCTPKRSVFGRGGGGRISLQISLFPSHYRIASRRPCLFPPPSEKKPDLQSLPTRLPPSPSWPRGGNRHRLHPAQGSAGPPPAPRPAPSPPRARLPPPGAAPSTRGRSAGRGSAEARPPAEPPLRAEEIQ